MSASASTEEVPGVLSATRSSIARLHVHSGRLHLDRRATAASRPSPRAVADVRQRGRATPGHVRLQPAHAQPRYLQSIFHTITSCQNPCGLEHRDLVSARQRGRRLRLRAARRRHSRRSGRLELEHARRTFRRGRTRSSAGSTPSCGACSGSSGSGAVRIIQSGALRGDRGRGIVCWRRAGARPSRVRSQHREHRRPRGTTPPRRTRPRRSMSWRPPSDPTGEPVPVRLGQVARSSSPSSPSVDRAARGGQRNVHAGRQAARVRPDQQLAAVHLRPDRRVHRDQPHGARSSGPFLAPADPMAVAPQYRSQQNSGTRRPAGDLLDQPPRCRARHLRHPLADADRRRD